MIMIKWYFHWQQLRENSTLVISLFIVNLIDFLNVHIAFHVLCTGNASKSFEKITKKSYFLVILQGQLEKSSHF